MSIYELEQFRQLAGVLADRKMVDVAIQTDKGTVRGIFDPLFKTVKVGGLTVPDRELAFWLKATYGCKVEKIKVITEEVAR